MPDKPIIEDPTDVDEAAAEFVGHGEGLALLREPFPASHIGQLPKAGITLDYVGHGAVTDRLLEADPLWTWEPFAVDDNGGPLMERDADGHPIALWIRLTVCDVTRIGVGTCPARQSDAEKVLIGDAIRNAAMRFGVALDLWIRGQGSDDEHLSNGAQSSTRRRTTQPPPVERLTDRQIAALGELAAVLPEDNPKRQKFEDGLKPPGWPKARYQDLLDGLSAAVNDQGGE